MDMPNQRVEPVKVRELDNIEDKIVEVREQLLGCMEEARANADRVCGVRPENCEATCPEETEPGAVPRIKQHLDGLSRIAGELRSQTSRFNDL